MSKGLLALFLLLAVTYAKQGLNFSFFEKEDRNKDGKITTAQFLNGFKTAVLKSVIFMKGVEKSEEMIKDYGEIFLNKIGAHNLINLDLIKSKVESGELLREFMNWREAMWRERIIREGIHDVNDPKVLLSPTLYGYKYRNLNDIPKRHDL